MTPGVKAMLIATLAFTVMQVLIKDLTNFHVFQIVFFRSSITAILAMAYLKVKKIPFRGTKETLLLLRAFCGIASMTLFFVTIQRIPLGASVSIKYLSPIFTAIFAVLLISEKIKAIQWLYFALALLGVFLLKGFDTRIDNLTFILGILGAIFGGMVYVIIRKIGQAEHSMVIVNYFMLSAAILGGIAMIPFWTTPSIFELVLLISMGAIGYFGQVYMTKAFQLESATRVAPIKYMELIYSLIIGLVWFGEIYSTTSFIGIVIVFIAMILNLTAKRSSENH